MKNDDFDDKYLSSERKKILTKICDVTIAGRKHSATVEATDVLIDEQLSE